VTTCFTFTLQLYVQYLSTVFLCGTMFSLRHKLNSLKLFRREPFTLFSIFPVACHVLMLTAANLTTLASCREEISRKFFTQITQPTSCLHHLLPDPRDHSIISRLRTYEKYPRVFTRTKRYCLL